MALPAAIASVVTAVSSFFSKREERKKAEESLDAKIKMHKQTSENTIELSEKEWEVLHAKNKNKTWVDEYLTASVFLPVNVIFLAVFFAVIFDNPTLATAAKEAVQALKSLIPEYENVVYVTLAAGLGIYVKNGFTR